MTRNHAIGLLALDTGLIVWALASREPGEAMLAFTLMALMATACAVGGGLVLLIGETIERRYPEWMASKFGPPTDR